MSPEYEIQTITDDKNPDCGNSLIICYVEPNKEDFFIRKYTESKKNKDSEIAHDDGASIDKIDIGDLMSRVKLTGHNLGTYPRMAKIIGGGLTSVAVSRVSKEEADSFKEQILPQ